MNPHIASIVAALGIFVGGCAVLPQAPVPLASTKVAGPEVRVGVAMAPLPKVEMTYPGAGCLLCLALASGVNSSLSAHTQTLPGDELKAVKAEIAELLRKRGATVTMIGDDVVVQDLPAARGETPNLARKDHSALRGKYNVDKLVVINVVSLGMQRAYSSYIPTGDPKAQVGGTGYMVNLSDNTYDWYAPFNVLRAADGPWDEPPRFPGLTNAYFQAIEAVKDSLKKALIE